MIHCGFVMVSGLYHFLMADYDNHYYCNLVALLLAKMIQASQHFLLAMLKEVSLLFY